MIFFCTIVLFINRSISYILPLNFTCPFHFSAVTLQEHKTTVERQFLFYQMCVCVCVCVCFLQTIVPTNQSEQNSQPRLKRAIFGLGLAYVFTKENMILSTKTSFHQNFKICWPFVERPHWPVPVSQFLWRQHAYSLILFTVWKILIQD